MVSLKHTSGDYFPDRVFLIKEGSDLEQITLSPEEQNYLLSRMAEDQRLVEINRFPGKMLFVTVAKTKSESQRLEYWRRKGNEVSQWAKNEKIASFDITTFTGHADDLMAFLEGALLGNYQFLVYQSNAAKLKSPLKEIRIDDASVSNGQLDEISRLAESVYQARDLVNEPVLRMNVAELMSRFKQMGDESGFTTEVFGKEAIEQMNMGGLLAVNKGSVDPPAFSVMEWKPEQPLNERPIVL
ncbi:MAG: hypothetical protein LWW85_01935, partial [Marinilabiliales bacterium]|nr:hypothetical protein [Marinilabiliales bacterium]